MKWGKLLAGISAIALWAGAAPAQMRTLDVPAGKAVEMLPVFAMQSGLQIVAPAGRLAGLRTPAIHGVYDVREALNRIIAGTNLVIVSEHGNVIVLRERGGLQPVSYSQPAPRTEAPGQAARLAPVPQAQTQVGADAVGDADAAPPAPDIVVVGSQIRGSKATEALPVTIVSKADIVNTAAVSGDELFRSIPQMGSVTFNSGYLPNSSNSARGDAGSVNLRELGAGNTLLLLNGRRVVQHPVSQADENLVPVISYNTNAIPVSGVERLEVLRDGAAAIYGTDAVAGVVNTVLKDNYNGISVDGQYGFAPGTNLRDSTASATIGHNFDRGNVTLFASFAHRDALLSGDEPYTATADLRNLFAGTSFAGSTTLDGRSTVTPWASLGTPASAGTIKAGTTSLTTSGGLFHYQPSTLSGCAYNLGNGSCLATGSLATTTTNRDERFDTPAAYDTSVIPQVDRLNLFLTGHYHITDGLELFGEAGYYRAKTYSVEGPTGTLSSVPITIPASNYWNPFGPVTFADGTLNPNRIPGLTNVPAAGLPVTIKSYLFSDAGPNIVQDTNYQYRLLGGVRFHALGFKWESALLYSQAGVKDVSDGISATLLQQNLALSTPDAYNPFNGANATNPSLADTTLSNQAAINAIKVKTVRNDTSTLALADLKGSNAALFDLPGGSVGLAIGGEVRRETQRDDRDPRLDGTTTFTDAITHVTYPSDLIGTSNTPDTFGKRVVASAYGELAIPVISPEMHIPLVRNIELQVAGRYEHYSDLGSVAKPKVAGAWDLVDGVRLRGSWSQGFKAPNLEQINATVVTRSNSRTDYIRCEADLRAGRITSFANCGESFSTSAQRSGNPDLKPETSDEWSAGIVLEPKFIPSRFGRLTATADLWTVKQKGIVGLFGEGNALILDYLDRLNGTTNANVIRAAPTAEDIALFQGTGIAPVGQVLYVTDQYRNLLPQTASGIDFGLNYQLRNTAIGSFSLDVNVAYLRKFYRDPSAEIAQLLAARAAGQINAGTIITGGGDLIEQGSRPRWRGNASFTWDYKQLQFGAYTQYIGMIDDTSLADSSGAYYEEGAQITGNAYIQFTIPQAKYLYKLRLGVRNIADTPPPISSSGYNAALYNPYGRYLYANIHVEM